ncbi:MAG: glycosyltransferase family 4 protein [Candidatus Stahlbacteria bacterium]|nr:glycosyltransferase family 4 protein [Candidatus Stahlbacteria bacterium]
MEKTILIISALNIWSMGKDKGAQSLWVTLRSYADEGYKVYFVTSSKGITGKLYDNIEIIRFSLEWVKKWLSLRKISFFARIVFYILFQVISLKLALNICKKGKIIAVYAYEIAGVPVCKILSKILKIPIISRFQGTSITPYIHAFLWKLRFFEHMIAYKIPVDLLIMADDGTQGDKVLNSLNINMEKVKFWMNGVDKNMYVADFDRDSFNKELSLDSKTKILLTVSRLVKWKRVDRIIRAMPYIISQSKEIVLMIVGDGEERENLTELAHKLNIIPYIFFVGAIPHEKVKTYMNAADIFVSLYELSNVGNPLLEAMICSKCIVTIDEGDTFKVVKNMETGILLNENEIETLPETIINLLNNEDLGLRLGKNAREYALNYFWSWEERMEKEMRTVIQVIEKKKSIQKSTLCRGYNSALL